jgi:hypothetical protein
VYVDNDPIVLAYAEALLTSAPEGATAYVPSDIRDTEKVLAGTAETLDLSRPVAVMALMVLQYIPDVDDPWGIVGRVLESLPPGSYLTVSDTVRDIDTGRVTEGTARLNQRMGPTQLTLRTRSDVERFFDGLEMVEPGVVPLPEWHGPGSEYPIPCYAGMGRSLSAQLAIGGVSGNGEAAPRPGHGQGGDTRRAARQTLEAPLHSWESRA